MYNVSFADGHVRPKPTSSLQGFDTSQPAALNFNVDQLLEQQWIRFRSIPVFHANGERVRESSAVVRPEGAKEPDNGMS